MASVEIISIYSEDGVTKVLHRDPVTGLQYISTAASASNASVKAAVESLAAQRKAANLDYAGKPESVDGDVITVVT